MEIQIIDVSMCVLQDGEKLWNLQYNHHPKDRETNTHMHAFTSTKDIETTLKYNNK